MKLTKTYFISALLIAAFLFSCKKDKKAEENQPEEIEVEETESSDDESSEEEETSKEVKSAKIEFSWDDIPESTADIGAFPYITPPKGMKIDNNTSDTQSYDFHKLEMFTGNSFFDIEGKVEKMVIEMASDKSWNQYLFDKSVDEYLKSIGAKLISDKKIPVELRNTWGETSEKQYEQMHNFYVGDVVNDLTRMYVLKTPNKKIGFQVYSNSAVGKIGVVEMKDFKQTIEKITASDILDEINNKGFATLYINFDTGKSRIKPDSYEVISEIAKMMNDNSDLKLSVEGHTDNVGDEASNLKLSENRAKSVVIALVDENIDESRLKSKGFGQTKPLEDNATDEGKAKNRRVELRKIK